MPQGIYLGLAGSDGEETAVRETWVRSLGQEDPLEKEMATYSSILARKIPGGLQSLGSQRVGQNLVNSL